MKHLILLITLSSIILCCSQTKGPNNFEHDIIDTKEGEKINGLCLVSLKDIMDKSNIAPMISVGANWIAVIPFGFINSLDDPELKFNISWQWDGERLDGAEKNIKLLHSEGLNVMLKPQVWVGHGAFTGNIEMKSEKDWLIFESSYSKYIIAFAKMAERNKVKMLCIGTELSRFARQRVPYWRSLINELREIYSGQLTYGENWDASFKVEFWDDLDFIGIDAYFPISSQKKPTLKQLESGWNNLLPKLKSLSETNDRKIIFTEYGYRSIVECAKSPWDYGVENEVSEEQQELALKALYNTIWKQKYFAGGFIWKWYPDDRTAGGPTDKMFTVQNKKAEELVRSTYSSL